MKENLEKAVQGLEMVISDLREAHVKANHTQAIIMLDLIRRTALLRIDVEALLNAHIADSPD